MAVPAPTIRAALPSLLTLMAATFVAVTTEMLPIGLLPLIGDEFLVSESQTGLLITLFAVMVAVLAVPATLLTARLPRKPLLLACLACYGISNACAMAAPNLALIAVGRVLGGLTHALFFSVCIGYAARLVAPGLTGRALAIASAGVSAAFVLGVPLGVSLGTLLGWRGAFAMVSGCAALTLLLAATTIPPVPVTRGRTSNRAGTWRRFATVLTSNGLVYLGHYLLFTYITVLLLTGGASTAALGPLLFGFGGGGLVTLIVAGRHFDAAPRRSLLSIVTVMAVGMAAAAALHPALIATVVACAVWNAAFGAVSPIYQAAAVTADATTPELAGAWVNATCNAGIALGAAIGGFVLDRYDIAAVGWTAAVITGVALAIAAVAKLSFPPRAPAQAGTPRPRTSGR
ncbi:MFS transporter [Micromonospora cathayae]|uniref:MFS transporter n=1 Tax=Micromonospora cathayae TaxID=3028804 RepID=A0ABY7ZJL5_9ACTN|nr:MFS transporter [Micromonospora sp. HUAS 3]WDZ83083.1 MFS transporter [Micromonospora sp. HUAS 3]